MPEYGHVAVDDLPDVPSATDHRRALADAVGAAELALNYFEAEPGQRIPLGGYHAHHEQEECFYVLSGTIVFDTAEGEITVGADEIFFAPPGHPHCGRAVGDEPARVLAMGAPAEPSDATVVEECASCGETTDREYATTEDGAERAVVLTCADCGAETDRFTAGPDE